MITALKRPDLLDRFTRSVASGWGKAPTGQTWAVSGGVATDYNVANGKGEINGASGVGSRFVYMEHVHSDIDASLDMTFASTATGVGVSSMMFFRWVDGSNHYRLVINFNVNGTYSALLVRLLAGAGTTLATVVGSAAWVVGDVLRCRVRAKGSRIQIKVWKTSVAEPAAWQTDVTDASFASGSRLWLYYARNSGNTSTDSRMIYDNLSLWSLLRLRGDTRQTGVDPSRLPVIA